MHKHIYGIDSIQSNVHNLSHVVDDATRFGCLNDISTYLFENRLYFIKHRLKQQNLPLQQIARRIVELSLDHDQLYSDGSSQNQDYPSLKSSFEQECIVAYKEIMINSGFTISSQRSADSWFLTNANGIVKMSHATNTNNKIVLYGWPIMTTCNYFTRPVSSNRFHIFQSDGVISCSLDAFKLSSIKAKFICLPLQDGFAFLPILHTFV